MHRGPFTCKPGGSPLTPGGEVPYSKGHGRVLPIAAGPGSMGICRASPKVLILGST
jgi:hypothetical protein